MIDPDTVDRPRAGPPGTPSRDDTLAEHRRVLAEGDHFFQQLALRDVEHPGADLAIELDFDSRLTNPRGALQGGLVASLADIVAGRAIVAAAPLDSAATIDLTIHYLQGITVGPARAAGRVVRRGRSLAVVNVDILDVGSGELCAVATVAFAIQTNRRSAGTEQRQEQ